MAQPEKFRIRGLFRRMVGLFRRSRGIRKEPEPPVDPYAYVTAPKKPRPSNRSGAAVAELSED